MIRLDTVNRSLTLFLGGAQVTAPLQVVVSYSDQTASTYLGASQLTNSNGVTVVTICAAPAASTIRDIDMVTVLNTDTATQTVTIQLLDTATNYKIITTSLLVGDKLTYTHGSAWQVVSSDGSIKYTVSGTVTSFSAGTTGFTPSTATSGAITLAGTLAIANGGSGATTAQTAMNAFAGATTSGSYLRGNGTNVVMATIQAADVPTLNQNTSGTASNVTGTVAIANGGTGQTTAGAAFNALSPVTTTGDLILGNGTNSATRLAIGTNGQVLQSSGTTASWVSKITNATAVTLTTQTTVEFTSLPSWVKRITVMFNGVSLSGTDQPIIQLGYGATPTYVTSGYSGGTQSISTTPTSTAQQPGTGFNILSQNAGNALVGIMTIVLFDAATNTWMGTLSMYNNSTTMNWSNGSIALSGTLTAVRLTRSGTNTFDAGTINILYE